MPGHALPHAVVAGSIRALRKLRNSRSDPTETSDRIGAKWVIGSERNPQWRGVDLTDRMSDAPSRRRNRYRSISATVKVRAPRRVIAVSTPERVQSAYVMVCAAFGT